MILKSFDDLRSFIKQRLEVNESVSTTDIMGCGEYTYSFFSALGLEGFYIPTIGNDISIPGANDLDEAQYGYSWNPKQKIQIKSWPSDLFVVAYQGKEAFAVNKKTQEVFYVSLDENNLWRSKPLFKDLFEMFYCFAVIGGIAKQGKLNFFDGNGVKSQYVDQAIEEMRELGLNHECINRVLVNLSWII